MFFDILAFGGQLGFQFSLTVSFKVSGQNIAVSVAALRLNATFFHSSGRDSFVDGWDMIDALLGQRLLANRNIIPFFVSDVGIL